MDIENMGKRIKEKRHEKKWRQEDLAEKTNLTSDYIGMIERGEKIPKLETFIKIVNALGTSADELLVDNLNVEYILRVNKYAQKLQYLNNEDKKKVCNIIEVVIDSFI